MRAAAQLRYPLPMRDRIDVIADLLLGAAYADDHLHEREQMTIRTLLRRIAGEAELPAGLAARIDFFDPAEFDLEATATAFANDPDDAKRELLELVGAVHDADDVLDLAEDDYTRRLAAALGVADDRLADLVVEVEVEPLRRRLDSLRAAPPPIPGSAETDVALDD